jgi:hypothetical protein
MVWKTAKADEKLALVRNINRIEPAYKFTPEDSHIETLDLPFYPNGKLVSLARPNSKGQPLCYVCLPSETVMLDGSVANIHHVNRAAPIQLSPKNIVDYLKFRIYFTKQGWLESVLVTESAGAFTAKARIQDPDGLFEATLSVSPQGQVSNVARDMLSPQGKHPPAQFSF